MGVNRRGQSLLEYIMLVTIIIIGIVVGGPYLVRSVQGYFKGTDESVHDSMDETFQQAGATIGAACTCDPGPISLTSMSTTEQLDFERSWSQTQCGIYNCGANERYHYRTCKPLRCGQEEACVPDPNCCAPAASGQCGSLVQKTGVLEECPNRMPVDSKFQGNYKGTCADVIGNDTKSCLAGERVVTQACGGAALYACQDDEDNCLPVCLDQTAKTQEPALKDSSYCASGNVPPYIATSDFIKNNFNADGLQTLAFRRTLLTELAYRKKWPNQPAFDQYTGAGANKGSYMLYYGMIADPAACNAFTPDRQCILGCPAGYDHDPNNGDKTCGICGCPAGQTCSGGACQPPPPPVKIDCWKCTMSAPSIKNDGCPGGQCTCGCFASPTTIYANSDISQNCTYHNVTPSFCSGTGSYNGAAISCTLVGLQQASCP